MPQFIYPDYCVDGCLDHFQFEAVKNNVAMNIFVQVFLGRYIHISVEYVCWIEFIGYKVCVCSALLYFATLFSKVVVLIFTLPVMYENSVFPHSHEA